jgi:hypothetical protein
LIKHQVASYEKAILISALHVTLCHFSMFMNNVLKSLSSIITTMAAISYITPIFLAVITVLSVAYYWLRVRIALELSG